MGGRAVSREVGDDVAAWLRRLQVVVVTFAFVAVQADTEAGVKVSPDAVLFVQQGNGVVFIGTDHHAGGCPIGISPAADRRSFFQNDGYRQPLG